MEENRKKEDLLIMMARSGLLDLLSRFTDLIINGELKGIVEWLDEILEGAEQHGVIVFDRVGEPGRRFHV